MDLEQSFQRLRDQAPDLAGEVQDLRGLGGVMAWMSRHGIPLARVEIVQQDEFSLDFVVPLDPDTRALVFAVT
jgi:hypothetical protein